MRLLATAALLLLAAARAAALGADMYTNPVVPVDGPDPGVLFWGGEYWMVVTTGDGALAYRIYRSPDLVHWTQVGYMFDAKTKPTWAVKSFWAPELHVLPRSPNRIVAVFSARDTSGELAIGSAWADHPAGPWHANNNKLARHSVGAIDAHIAIDNSTADPYLVWKVDGNSAGSETPIVAQKLNDDATATLTTPVTLIKVDQPWEGPLIEGPWVLFHNGYYWLFYSATGYADPSYAVGVARAKSLLGPYTKAAGPLLSQIADKAPTQPFTAPGHCSVVRVPSTGAIVIIYHAWLAGHLGKDPGRVILTDRVWFDAPGANGWPVIGVSGNPSSMALPVPTSVESAQMPADMRLYNNGTNIALATYQWADHCWSADGTIDGKCGTEMFTVKPGNAGPGTVSLAFGNKFWRHRNSMLYLEPSDGTALFNMDSSWVAHSGLRDKQLVSFRSINYQYNFIRHYNGRLIFSKWDGTQQLAEDATFRILRK